MQLSSSELITEPSSVDRRLAEMNLTREGLLRVRDIALGAAAEATAYHPSFSPGMKSYMEGIAALRFEFIQLGSEWRLEEHNGMDFIRNDALEVRLGFSNVKGSVLPDVGPRARSPRGPGTERACQSNFSIDFGEEFKIPEDFEDKVATYFLMVDKDGCAEVSKPIIQAGNFADYLERLSISDGSDFNLDPTPLDDDDDLSSFDPMVTRR
ncbi:hypothetical protein KZO83_10750 [Chromohalobacter sp. TMW 2.2308]|uniref:hypothetical protein n=1 Tax=Chromohalobacter TaxID=42054 RepID=UPI001FFC7431|nr:MULTISPECIES: hypothetical protein [Chromohalobacter]MCK2043175.1 hypothetical protein [Chromohalobacter moromii]MCT8515588.1 hypothetical protein [Chromohalobacter sp. TMW 2.2271]